MKEKDKKKPKIPALTAAQREQGYRRRQTNENSDGKAKAGPVAIQQPETQTLGKQIVARQQTTQRTSGGFGGGGKNSITRQQATQAAIPANGYAPTAALRLSDDRQQSIQTLGKNMTAWHTADAAKKQQLEAENATIRARLGLGYDARTGVTIGQQGENLSLPVLRMMGGTVRDKALGVRQMVERTAAPQASEQKISLGSRILDTIEASTKRVRAGLDNYFATGNLAAKAEAEEKFLRGEDISLFDQLRLRDRWGDGWKTYLSDVREAYRTGKHAVTQEYEQRAAMLNAMWDTTPLFNEAATQAERAKVGAGPVGRVALDALGMGADMLGNASIASTGGGGGLLYTGVSSAVGAGTAADQARRMGASAAQQEDYGNAVGALNFATERLGGIGGGELSGKIAKKVLPQIVQDVAEKATSNTAGRIIAGALGEGLEGALQSEGERGLRNVILDAGETFDAGSFAADVGYNALMGGIFRGGQEVGARIVSGDQTVRTDDTTNRYLQAEQAAQEVNSQMQAEQKASLAGAELENNRTLNQIIAENHDTIAQTGVLAEMTGKEFSGGERKLVDQITDFFKSIGNKVTRVGFGDVVLNRSGARDSISHGIGRNKAIAFAAVPSVIENGTVIDMQHNWKGRRYDTVTFGGRVRIGGIDYDMGVIVKQYDNAENRGKYYLHEVETIPNFV